MSEINNEEIWKECSGTYVECPDCVNMEDDQYTCTTCWCEGGNGKILVTELLDMAEELKQNGLNDAQKES